MSGLERSRKARWKHRVHSQKTRAMLSTHADSGRRSGLYSPRAPAMDFLDRTKALLTTNNHSATVLVLREIQNRNRDVEEQGFD